MKIERRQAAHLADLDLSAISECISAVQSAFEEAWLDGPGEHPIQKLWKRPYAGATNELVNLGYALRELENKKPGLAEAFARKIKKQDLNNQRGLLFELLVIGGMFSKHGKVGPTPANAPGYDLRIAYDDGSELLLSLKSWGASQHERIFRKKAADFEKHVQKLARRSGCHSVNVRAVASSYPEEAAWNTLRAALHKGLNGQPFARSSLSVEGEWSLVVGPSWSPNGPVSETNLSHEVFVLSPYHRNEITNFQDKLKAAIANAEKHFSAGIDRMHGIVARVPANLSWSDANSVVSAYLAGNASGLIGLILLVQAAVVTDENNLSSQHIYVKPHGSAAYTAWASSKRDIGLRLMLATTGSEASKNVLSVDGKQVDLNDMYSYHSGDIFVRFDGSDGSVSRLAPGLRQHAVMRVGGQESVLSGKFPENDDLVLFD